MTRQQLLEGVLVDLLGRGRPSSVQYLGRRRIHHRMDLGRAADDPDAPEVHIAHLPQVGELEVPQRGEAIVVGVVVVPREARCVEEDEVVRQVVVVVDNVRQVHHGLAALVLGHRQRRLGVIDDVDALLPFRRQVPVKPCCVIALDARDDDIDLPRCRPLLLQWDGHYGLARGRKTGETGVQRTNEPREADQHGACNNSSA